MGIRLLLLAGAGALAFVLLRGRGPRSSAFARVMLFLLLVGFVVAVISPELLTAAANAVGVGRGTDLLVYALTVAVLYLAITTYLKLRDVRDQVTVLARRIALDEAARAGEGPNGQTADGSES
ncbi:MAG: DUF2304 domain-containing protein [Candidatus Nanopelagicales bacterium]